METATDALTVFEINKQVVGDRPAVVLANSDRMSVVAHVWDKGGEVSLHSHHSSDACWVVVQGQATFYGPDDQVLATVERGAGVFIPRNVKYWFESTSDETLMMVRSAAKGAPELLDDRVIHSK